MRFIWNFILFGVVFFLIHKFFPEAFNTLVSWVDHGYEWVVQAVTALVAKIQGTTNNNSGS